MASFVKTHLSDDLCLYTAKSNNPITLTYQLESTCFNIVQFTLSIEGSKNFAFDQDLSLGTTKTTRVSPCKMVHVGRVVMIDPSFKAELKVDFSWDYVDFNQKELKAMTDGETKAVGSVIAAYRRSLTSGGQLFDDNDASVEQIVYHCEKHGCCFVDLSFPPIALSLRNQTTVAGSSSSAGTADNSPTSMVHRATVWRRPKDFTPADVEMEVFRDGIIPNDIKQGLIANCWVLSAIASIAEFPYLIEELFLKESQSVCAVGLYEVRLCKRGLWRVFRLDDFVPCFPSAGTVYSRAHDHELWVLLLEKAYAKSVGSYAGLRSGWAFEALIDFTGFPYRNFRLDDESVQAQIRSGQFWADLLRYDETQCVMCASTPGEDDVTERGKMPRESSTGLVAGHAYSLIAVKQLRNGVQLVCMRNPWGNFEWKGDWSDSSPLWTEEIKMEVNFSDDPEDGLFWMSFQDMCQYFFSVNIAVQYASSNRRSNNGNSNSNSMKRWKETRIPFSADLEPVSQRQQMSTSALFSEGWVVNTPMFVVRVSEGCTAYVSIHQQDRRDQPLLFEQAFASYIDLGLTLLKLKDSSHTASNHNDADAAYDYVCCAGPACERQIQTDELLLSPGVYLVVPTISGTTLQSPSSSANSMNNEASLVPLINWEKGQSVQSFSLSPQFILLLEDLFSRLDVTKCGHLGLDEMNRLSRLTEEAELTGATLQWIQRRFGCVGKPGVTLAAFKAMHLYLVQQLLVGVSLDNVDNVETALTSLRSEVSLLGYCPRSLHRIRGRPLTLVLHSSVAVHVEASAYDFDASLDAHILPTLLQGECTPLDGDQLEMWERGSRSGGGAVSLVCLNKSSMSAVWVSVDCSASTGLLSHRDSLLHECTIPPGAAVLMHLLVPRQEADDSWAVSYQVSYRWS